MYRLGILGSRRGANLVALMTAIRQRQLTAEIAVVISDKSDAMILQRASDYQLNAEFVDPNNMTRVEYDEKISILFTSYAADLIVLVGYMRILSNEFVAKWRHKMINIHPSLLPAFAGGMDQAVHQAVLDSGIKETGCTVHYVTEELDAGPILLQKKCIVLPHDTVDTLKARVQELEGVALIEVIGKLAK